MARVRIGVRGVVQGVGFRPFVYRIATQNELNGYVRNLGDAGVEIVLEGQQDKIDSFLKDLESKKPLLARIYESTVVELLGQNQFEDFSIQQSSAKADGTGSVIPPDVAICDNCLRELRNPLDQRHDYFFITCTDCGPRYSIIEGLPYDREVTTMKQFSMCDQCGKEYEDPDNRRFHAQTIACPKCGPTAYLADSLGNYIQSSDPIREAGRLISRGLLVAVKGYGGFHIAASVMRDEPLERLRNLKHRKQKPFAIMARDLESVSIFAKITPNETDLLTSPMHPIVLLNKKSEYNLSSLVAPGLHNVGVMLPYTGLHHMLFDRVDDLAFTMTSANPPNQPVVSEDSEALSSLNETVDRFLFHNREIAQKCDDSVLRFHGSQPVFLRRSRGYAPAPVLLQCPSKSCVLALGGEENNTVCLFSGDKAFLSQHIGDVENLETRSFLQKAAEHLIHLTNSRVESVACDLHPRFVTTELAGLLAEKKEARLTQVQHHHAHVASLMAEHGLEEMIGICCDGYGYGSDGNAWGGEVLQCHDHLTEFERPGHLEEQPLPGGDLATRYPIRVAAGILDKANLAQEWLLKHSQDLPHGEEEVEVILKQLKTSRSVNTTSCGRVLDSVAALLEVCFERTYEGEPAMKLESLAYGGKDVLQMTPLLTDGVLNTTEMLVGIFENTHRHTKKDLAYSAHLYLARGLAEIAVSRARQEGIDMIGFTGGVACNILMTLKIKEAVESQGLRLITHNAIPPGDGGLSFGQAAVASRL